MRIVSRRRTAFILCALALGLGGPASAQPAAPAGLAAIRRSFAAPPDESRPMVRWWWFGPFVTPEEIEAEMRRMKEGGFGGFELAVVYPMALDDPVAGLVNERYLSPGFLDKVAFASRKARELGLRMDVTIGSGWSYGGPDITPHPAPAPPRSRPRQNNPDPTRTPPPGPYDGV